MENLNTVISNFDELKWDIEEILNDWLNTADSKREELQNIKSIINDPNLDNGNVDMLYNQLCEEYNYDENDLYDYLESEEGIKLMQKSAEWVFKYNKAV